MAKWRMILKHWKKQRPSFWCKLKHSWNIWVKDVKKNKTYCEKCLIYWDGI